MCVSDQSSQKGISTAYPHRQANQRQVKLLQTQKNAEIGGPKPGLGATQVTMTDKADSTHDEPMPIPEPQKPGVSEETDPAKAAQEILLALDESGLGGNSPEAKRVKELVKNLEKTMQDTLKKSTPGSSASSTAGSFVVLGPEDDPMKSKSPRTKRSATGTPPRAPTPEGKRKFEGPLKERLEMKDRDSLGDEDFEVLLESLKELDKVRSHEADETKRRKADDEQVKLAKDENSSLQSTIKELRERGQQMSAQHETKVKAHEEAVSYTHLTLPTNREV